MKLIELLDSKYEWDGFYKENDSHYVTRFTTDDGEEVEANIIHWSGAWEIEFSRDGTHGLTGAGDAIKIFGTILDIIKEFIDSENPKFITFSSKLDEESRVKFYRRFAKKIESFGYKDISDADLSKYDKQIQTIVQRKGSKHFLLVRKDLVS